jgi:hypothetical protein
MLCHSELVACWKSRMHREIPSLASLAMRQFTLQAVYAPQREISSPRIADDAATTTLPAKS